MTTPDGILIADLAVLAVDQPPELAGLPGLNVGCGTILCPHDVNVDSQPLAGVDVVADLDDKWPWRDGSVRYIKAAHVFEHVADPVMFMCEAWRVLAPGGLLDIRVPFYQHPNAYADPTHRRFCTERTFEYWIRDAQRQVAFGAAYGSPPAVYSYADVLLNGQEQEELQAILRKETG